MFSLFHPANTLTTDHRALLSKASEFIVFLWLQIGSFVSFAGTPPEIITHKIMSTALLILPHKVQMEKELIPAVTYSSQILNCLVQRHPNIAPMVKRASADTSETDYVSHRSKAIDSLLEKILETPNPPKTLIALAAGFDTRPLRYQHYFDQIYEMDLPAMIDEKQAVYNQLEMAQSHTLIAGDITHKDWLETLPKENVVLTLEGILPYLCEEQARTVLRNLARHFRNSHVLIETLPEYMIPSARLSFSAALVRWLMSNKDRVGQGIPAFRSDGSFLYADAIGEWTTNLPPNRITYETHLSSLGGVNSWKLTLSRLLGLATPRITWLRIN